MWIVIGFAALGLLIGNLVGLTSESAVNPLLSLLFVFVGGSVLGFLHKLDSNDRAIAGGSVLSLSVCCLVGVYFAIWTNQHRWLSPTPASSTQANPSQTDQSYLRSASMIEADLIDRQKEQGAIGLDEAYAQMYRLVRKYTDTVQKENR
jgi:hypothetical protein